MKIKFLFNCVRTMCTAGKLKGSACDISDSNLVGRDYIDPRSLSNLEMKSLLWTAIDIKYLTKQRSKIKADNVRNARITLILNKPCVFTQLALTNSARLLNASLNIIIDPCWDQQSNMDDFGHALAICSDLIFCKTDKQSTLASLADGSHIPVISVKSHEFNSVKALTDAMTLQLHYDYLSRLTIAWVGVPDPLINAYLYIFPRLGMNIKYCCINKCEPCMPPSMIATALKYCQQNNTELHECTAPCQAIYRSDVIATSAHNNPMMCITMRDIKEAAINWSFLHPLPRGLNEVEKEVVSHQNSLVWKSISNAEWIYSALILRFLTGYEHVTQQPDFNKSEGCK